MTDKIQGLERIARLLDEGKLSREEYDALKEEMLNSSEPPPPTTGNIGSGAKTSLTRGPSSPLLRLGRLARKRVLGWVFITIGALGALASGIVESNQPSGFQFDAWYLGLLINPLVWLAIVGGYLVDKARKDERRRV